LLLTGCPKTQQNQKTHKSTGLETQAFVVLHGSRKTLKLQVELAITPRQREKGLMFRRYLPPDHGMLFIFERPVTVPFWMKNTYIPLDMIFVDDAFRVVGIVRNARPLSTQLLGTKRPFKYVIEVNAGLSEKIGLENGSRIDILW